MSEPVTPYDTCILSITSAAKKAQELAEIARTQYDARCEPAREAMRKTTEEIDAEYERRMTPVKNALEPIRAAYDQAYARAGTSTGIQ
jgi:hypothetical protein